MERKTDQRPIDQDFLRSHIGNTYKRARRMGAGPEDAEEIVANIMRSIARRMQPPDFTKDIKNRSFESREEVEKWTCGAVKKQIADRRRRHFRERDRAKKAIDYCRQIDGQMRRSAHVLDQDGIDFKTYCELINLCKKYLLANFPPAYADALEHRLLWLRSGGTPGARRGISWTDWCELHGIERRDWSRARAALAEHMTEMLMRAGVEEKKTRR